MDDLITWLRAQLDDDERKANSRYKPRPDGPRRIETAHLPGGDLRVRVDGAPPQMMTSQQYTDAFLEPNPDQRLLREVEAKRKIVNFAELTMWDRVLGPEERESWEKLLYVLKLTALPFDDRPGYLEEWRP